MPGARPRAGENMRPNARSLASLLSSLLALAALLASACGGSSSETPFPPEPIGTPSRLQPIAECHADAECGDAGPCVRGACAHGRGARP
jgi:hypothetical protein